MIKDEDRCEARLVTMENQRKRNAERTRTIEVRQIQKKNKKRGRLGKQTVLNQA